MRLETLLASLAHGQTLAEIAQSEGIAPSLLDQMMLDLVRGGYLERFAIGCSTGSCAGCSLAKSCRGVSGWRLTERGKSIIESLDV